MRGGLTLVLGFMAAQAANGSTVETHYDGRTEYPAPMAILAPVVDGVADDNAWESAPWQEIGTRWLGP
jgi:hypothetical protein